MLSEHLRRRLADDFGLRGVVLLPNAVAIPATVAKPAGDCDPVAVFGGEVSGRKGLGVKADDLIDTLIDLADWQRV